jgi:2,4-dienoyl-CoA reductase-like NADH-dependent reductase (Old Yellow Enzyme family)
MEATERLVAAGRDHYLIFSPARIGRLYLPNRLVRSATWDPSILGDRALNDDVRQVYRRVAAGGVGLIITGDFSVVPPGTLDEGGDDRAFSYDDVRIADYGDLVEIVHAAGTGCKIIAQISADYPGVAPSAVPSPYTTELDRPLSAGEIGTIVNCFVETIAGLQAEGFDGVQLHAAHGGLLSRFVSPYTNRRQDRYGGPAASRARIIAEIVAGARQRVGDFPILIKLNGTDYLPGGTDLDSLPELAQEIERAGVDAMEISGGMWECLVRSQEELGFRPVPSAESQTRLRHPARQSYFLPYAERLSLSIPVILVGGNRDVERLEAILRRGSVDLIALCRPLISEPDLPQRWRQGRGSSVTDCISCNSCLYDMYTRLERGEPGIATCLVKQDLGRVKEAGRWLRTWVKENASQ